MEEIELTWNEFTGLRRLKTSTQRGHAQWISVFSTNCREDLWSVQSEGYSSPDQRSEMRGQSRAADRIADALLRVRSEGGRIFVDERGAFYRNKFGDLEQFAIFKIRP